MAPTETLAKDLRLGDIVRAFNGEYATATVIKITPTAVTLYRPYVHTSDVEYSGGGEGCKTVIAYIGTETWSLWIGDTRLVTLLRRGPELR